MKLGAERDADVKVTETGRILVLTHEAQSDSPLLDELSERFEVVRTDSFAAGLRKLREEEFSGLFLFGEKVAAAALAEAGGVLEQVDDGFALLDQDLHVFWCNAALQRLSGSKAPTVGRNFYELFGTPEILGPDFCPFHTALGSGETAKSTLRVGEKSYFEVQVTPLFENGAEIPEFLIVVVRDISTEVLQQQKLDAIYQAGLELGDLSAQELMDMSVDGRIEL
ncbi:MAG TPA: PAS domain-containing protein, partial [Planctomycetaceae bacterium]|nr:PAS domain-containing protein [Planctomycetaceae bacterium]